MIRDDPIPWKAIVSFISHCIGVSLSFSLSFYLKMTSKQPLDYSQDPKHDSCQLIVRKDAPFNAEPCPVDLVKNYITPEKYFFCRNHGPLPEIQEAEHTILVQGIGCDKPTYFNMKQIKQDYEKASVMMVMQVCNAFCFRT